MIILFSYICLYLKISYTFKHVSLSILSNKPSNIKISAYEINVRAKDIFYNIDEVNLFISSIIVKIPSEFVIS